MTVSTSGVRPNPWKGVDHLEGHGGMSPASSSPGVGLGRLLIASSAQRSRAVTERSEGHPGTAGVDGPAQRSYPRAHARPRPRSGRHSPLLERRVLRRRDALAAQHPRIGAAVGAPLVGQHEFDAPLVAVVKDVGDPLAVSQVELAQR